MFSMDQEEDLEKEKKKNQGRRYSVRCSRMTPEDSMTDGRLPDENHLHLNCRDPKITIRRK